ncbi:amidohydrolase family protein [Rhodococcus rhodochrous]|uniref:amidohydrolase family protein n=1 Tax=Rhodococcus rhodochrous TaxID=1829 RepID=UPI000306A069|nr:amidohydrolase family protein [Rhodococcus rhodochrous]
MTTETPARSGEHDILSGLKIIDSDTHFSEPHDLWTSRAPASMRDRLPKVVRTETAGNMAGTDRQLEEGGLTWQLDGQLLSPAGGVAFVRRDGSKIPFFELDITDHGNLWNQIHEASYDAKARVKFMDEIGVHAHIVYPNIMGFSIGNIILLEDKELAYAAVSIYNDAMAEWASEAPNRLFPQAVLPFWDIELAAKEAERCHDMGFKGVIMAGEPHLGGLPDLGQPDWNPLYEVIDDKKMPINIHIGARVMLGADSVIQSAAWPSLPKRATKPVNSVQTELGNSRFLSNIVVSDVLHRWPNIKWVSVESGIGWMAYVLERVDYEYLEDFPDAPAPDVPSAFEMFRRNVYGTFWFEKAGPTMLLDYIGADNVMWESDFPHPTCLHPDAIRRSAEALASVNPAYVRKIMQDNAAQLYNIPLD